MQDNAPPHSARSTKQWFADHNIPLLPWPASSPDLNLIEHVWALMKERISRHVLRPTIRAAMRAAVQDEWNAVSEHDLNGFLDSIPRRIQAVIVARGGPTAY